MRDFRDAKAMAQTLRQSLTDKSLKISHSESLELVSRMLGAADWNTLSAAIQAGQRAPREPVPQARDTAARYPAIPLRDLVPFPGAIYPVFVGRARTVHALEQAFQRQRELVLAVQKSSGVDEPTHDDVYEIGVLAALLELERQSDGTIKVLTQIYRRVAIDGFAGDDGGYVADVRDISEGPISAAPESVRDALARFAAYADAHDIRLPDSFQVFAHGRDSDRDIPDLMRARDPGRLADIISTHIKLPVADKQALLATLDPVARLQKVDALLAAG